MESPRAVAPHLMGLHVCEHVYSRNYAIQALLHMKQKPLSTQ